MGNRGRNDSSSESDDWEDGSWIVDCPCGVSFDDGEEMVECDECGVWVHTACCRVPKLLPSYVCDKCKYKKKQKEEESEVAQLLADLPSKPVSFEEKSVQKAEVFTPFRVPNDLPTEAKAHVTGIPGGDPSFFVGAPQIFGRQLWTYSGYVPKRFNVEYDQLGDPREDTAELLRDLPNVVVPPVIEERLKRLALVQENSRVNTGNRQGSLQMYAEASTPNPVKVPQVSSSELLSDEARAQDVAFRGKQVKSSHIMEVDAKAEGKADVTADEEGQLKHRQKSKVKDEKSHVHAKRAREDVRLEEHISRKKIRVRGDALKSEDPVETVFKLEGVPETGFVPVTHAISHTSPKNPKAMKKLAVQEFMHGVLKICSRCRDISAPLNCGLMFYLSEWTCQKCGSVEGGIGTAGSRQEEAGILKTEHEALTGNAGTCSDKGIVDRKSGNRSDAFAGEMLTSKVCLLKSGSESKCSPSDDTKDLAGANKNSGSVYPDPQVEKKVSKLQLTSIISETKGQGSARTSGCLPASVREKFSQQQQQRAVSVSVGALHHVNCGQSPVQTPAYSAQKVVSPSSVGAAIGAAFTKGSLSEDSRPLQANEVGYQEGIITQTSKQVRRSTDGGSEGIQRSGEGLFDIPLLSQASLTVQHLESEWLPRARVQLGEGNEKLRTEGLPDVGSSPQFSGPTPAENCGVGATCDVDMQEQKVALPICQQARQSNGVGTYSRKWSGQIGGASASHNSEKTAANVRMATSAKNDLKVVGGQKKSPLSSGTCTSPTSPLVTTPSSKVQPHSSKASGSPPPQKSLSGGTTPKSSSISPHGSLKASTLGTTSCKHIGTQHSSKSVHTCPPHSSKAVNMAKQSSKSSLLVPKPVDLSMKASTALATSRSSNHCGPSSGASTKESVKSTFHSSSKVSAAGKIVPQSTITKPPSLSKHSHGTTKAIPVSGQNKQHLGSSKLSIQASAKPIAAQHSKALSTHKDEKSSMLPTPVPKAVSTMPPAQVPAKRSPPTMLTSPATTTLKDEELALLLHQELNSSPRVPRVPRVRQAGASLQLTSISQASMSSGKGTVGSASSGGGSHKVSVDHVALRRRTREDRLSNKDGDRNTGRVSAEEVAKAGVKKPDDGKGDGGRSISESVTVSISFADGKESASALGSQSVAEGSSRHHLLGRGNLSIIVPGAEDVPDGEKKSPPHGSVFTLPGLIEELLNSKGQQVSYDDVCEAILPHWPKLRKPNGERYPYSSHRQAVLESLRSRPAWAHLVDRTKVGRLYRWLDLNQRDPVHVLEHGLQTYVARKRRRNESTTLSDSESDPAPNGLEHQAYDGLGTTKSSRRSKSTEGEKGDGGSFSAPKSSADVLKGKRRVRRRRRLAMDDGTDGEDEPRTRTEQDAGTIKSAPAKGVSQEDDPDSISSPSSEEAVSNYSEEDEEMVVHRGMRNRRRRGHEGTGSEDDMD